MKNFALINKLQLEISRKVVDKMIEKLSDPNFEFSSRTTMESYHEAKKILDRQTVLDLDEQDFSVSEVVALEEALTEFQYGLQTSHDEDRAIAFTFFEIELAYLDLC